jgi:hypothetical protein
MHRALDSSAQRGSQSLQNLPQGGECGFGSFVVPATNVGFTLPALKSGIRNTAIS